MHVLIFNYQNMEQKKIMIVEKNPIQPNLFISSTLIWVRTSPFCKKDNINTTAIPTRIKPTTLESVALLILNLKNWILGENLSKNGQRLLLFYTSFDCFWNQNWK